jgi:hypothetical protein
MKIGKEVEGHNSGVPTLFLQYSEILKINSSNRYLGQVDQIYLSDHECQVTVADIDYIFARVNPGIKLVIETTKVRKDLPENPDVSYMVTLKFNDVSDLFDLRAGVDQIKITSPNKYVLTFSGNFRDNADCYITVPSDFDGDTDI